MNARILFAGIAMALATAGLADKAIAQPAPTAAVVVRSLAEAPTVGGAPYASYVVFIPTHEGTGATTELLSAIRHVSDVLAAAAEQSPSAAIYLGASDPSAYDAAGSASTIADLNARYGFGLDPSGGAVLLFVHGDPATAARDAVYARVFQINDPGQIVAALNETEPRLIDKGIGPSTEPTLWDLIKHIFVPSTTPTAPTTP